MLIESENFTIYEVEEIRDKLLEEFNIYKDIQIDLSNIQKIDMPAIQLLISLQKSCFHKNKAFEIINVRENIYKAFQVSGCDTVLGVCNG